MIDPIVNVTLFRENKGYAFSNISAMLNYGATFAISYLISIYLQVVMGYSSQTAGLIMIFQPIIMAVLSPVMGRFSDRIDHTGDRCFDRALQTGSYQHRRLFGSRDSSGAYSRNIIPDVVG